MGRFDRIAAVAGLLSLLALAGCVAPRPPEPAATPGAATAPSPGAALGAGGRGGLSAAALGTAALGTADTGQSVLFAPGTADLTPDARRQLAAWAAILRRRPGQPVTIVGHGDERSTRDFSIALGARRAHAVKAYLVALGVPAERLATTSVGMERPAAPGFAEEARTLDRRAELVFESLAAVPQ